jgi:thiol-disulfide isomerase/thioredoxin
MPNANKILIEVMYKADYCLPCFYMDQTVLEVLAKYADSIEYQRVDFLRGEGKKRFLELSCSLYGQEIVNKHCRVAPVPSLFIDGELVFDAIPPIFELEDAIEEAIQQKRSNQMR